MALKNNFGQSSPFGKIALLVVLMVVGVVIAMLILFAINLAFFQVPMDVLNHISENSSALAINSAKALQITSQIGLFIIPAFAYAYLTSNSVTQNLRLNRRAEPHTVVFAILITILAIPFINLLAQWNTDWHLPESWHSIEDWMRQTQVANDKMIGVLAKMDTKSDIMINTLMMAILPALGEELIFRGVLQPQIIKWVKNSHVGIILTAILFSAIHLQFLGFFSRAILGILFGYLFYYSKNIRYPILAHFINNFLALMLVYLFGSEMEDNSFENPYDTTTVFIAIGTFIVSLGLFFFTRKQFIEESKRMNPY